VPTPAATIRSISSHEVAPDPLDPFGQLVPIGVRIGGGHQPDTVGGLARRRRRDEISCRLRRPGRDGHLADGVGGRVRGGDHLVGQGCDVAERCFVVAPDRERVGREHRELVEPLRLNRGRGCEHHRRPAETADQLQADDRLAGSGGSNEVVSPVRRGVARDQIEHARLIASEAAGESELRPGMNDAVGRIRHRQIMAAEAGIYSAGLREYPIHR
jgi:hypothetical protein